MEYQQKDGTSKKMEPAKDENPLKKKSGGQSDLHERPTKQ
jgi:hypothetical protein